MLTIEKYCILRRGDV